MNARVPSSDLRNCCIVALVGAALYLSLLSINYDSNGIGTARGVEAGNVTSPNHMLFEMTGFVALRGAELLGHTGPSFRLLQALAAICGGFALAGTYLAARSTGAEVLAALTATVWLGATWSFWTWSTNVAYVSMAAMLVAATVALLWRANRTTLYILTGITAALSVLAWQANVFLLPVLLAGIWMLPQFRQDRARWSVCLVLGFGMTLAVIYMVAAARSGIYDVRGMVDWLSSYGQPGSTRVSSWGRWGWDRPAAFVQTWIRSMVGSTPPVPRWFLSRPIRFDTVFPRLAPIALAVFFIVPFLVLLREAADRFTLWCLIGLTSYALFAIWWDPFETKWLLVPNVFVALLAAHLWSSLASRKTVYYLAPAAAATLFVSTLSLYGIPGRARVSLESQIGDCVGSHMAPSDQYIATDWAFGGYVSYKYDHDFVDLIDTAIGFHLDKAKTFRAFGQRIRDWQEGGAAVYVTDPTSGGPADFRLLKALTGITQSDVERAFPGEPAFDCHGWPIRRLNEVSESAGTWESLGNLHTIQLPLVPAIYKTDQSDEKVSVRSGSIAVRSEGGTAPEAFAFIENSATIGFKTLLSSQETVRDGGLWLVGGRNHRTAIAFVNPQQIPIEIEWVITDAQGRKARSGIIRLAARAGLARYADEDPFAATLASKGLLHFSTRDGVVATSILEEKVNGPTLSDSMAAVDLDPTRKPSGQFVSLVERGGNKSTRIVLANPYDEPMTGSALVFDDRPNRGGDSLAQTIPYTIPARGIFEHLFERLTEVEQTGWLMVAPTSGGTPLVLAEIEDRNTQLKMIVQSHTAAENLWVYGGQTPSYGDILAGASPQVRIINPGAVAVMASLSLRAIGRGGIGSSTVEIPARTTVVVSTNSIPGFENIAGGWHTLLEIAATGGPVLASVILDQFDGGRNAVFAAHPQQSNPVTYLSRIVFGGGYSTALFLDTAGSKSPARIDFSQSTGEVADAPIRRWIPPGVSSLNFYPQSLVLPVYSKLTMEAQLIIFLACVTVTMTLNTLVLWFAYKSFAGVATKVTDGVREFQRNSETQVWLARLETTSAQAVVVTEAAKARILEFEPILARAQAELVTGLIRMDSQFGSACELFEERADRLQGAALRPVQQMRAVAAGISGVLESSAIGEVALMPIPT